MIRVWAWSFLFLEYVPFAFMTVRSISDLSLSSSTRISPIHPLYFHPFTGNPVCARGPTGSFSHLTDYRSPHSFPYSPETWCVSATDYRFGWPTKFSFSRYFSHLFTYGLAIPFVLSRSQRTSLQNVPRCAHRLRVFTGNLHRKHGV